MDKEQKTLKSPLSAKNVINPLHCEECKAKVAGEAQESLARQIIMDINIARRNLNQIKDYLMAYLDKK